MRALAVVVTGSHFESRFVSGREEFLGELKERETEIVGTLFDGQLCFVW